MGNTFPEEYAAEQARLRELIEVYREIGPAGSFGASAITAVLNAANKAAAEHDTVAMIRCLVEMRECE